MKITLEKLNQQKFSPLTKEAKLQIRGGGVTGGSCVVVKFERVDGRDRDYVKEWSSDESDGRDICYYGVTYRWTDWY